MREGLQCSPHGDVADALFGRGLVTRNDNEAGILWIVISWIPHDVLLSRSQRIRNAVIHEMVKPVWLCIHRHVAVDLTLFERKGSQIEK